jgi:uncharacterized membrane protein YuzA (DUF378 family)
MTKETAPIDVVNWYFLSFTSLYAAARGLFDYNILTEVLNLSGGGLAVVFLVFGVSGVYNLVSLLQEGP